MKNDFSSEKVLTQEIHMAEISMAEYYERPLNAIRILDELEQHYPELREEFSVATEIGYWSPLAESEVLVRLRWYVHRLTGETKHENMKKRTA